MQTFKTNFVNFIALLLVCMAFHKCSSFTLPPRTSFNRPSSNVRLLSKTAFEVAAGSAVDLECVAIPAVSKESTLPPLVFIHGSYHAAWCWIEHWAPYFAEKGYPTYSISLRGTSGSPIIENGVAKSEGKVGLKDHSTDIRAFLLDTIERNHPNSKGSILIAHSFGGMAVLKLFEDNLISKEETSASKYPLPLQIPVQAAAFLCSVPPSGNMPMTNRFLGSRPKAAFKIFLGFVFKWAASKPSICRDLFFRLPSPANAAPGEGDCAISEIDLEKYMSYFQKDSVIGLDLQEVTRELPSLRAKRNERAGVDGATEVGEAEWIEQVRAHVAQQRTGAQTQTGSDKDDNQRAQPQLPFLVLGTRGDYIVDEEGVNELARFLGLDRPAFLDGVPHDLMLGKTWQQGADTVLKWLQTL